MTTATIDMPARLVPVFDGEAGEYIDRARELLITIAADTICDWYHPPPPPVVEEPIATSEDRP